MRNHGRTASAGRPPSDVMAMIAGDLRNPNFDPRHRLVADSERPSDKITECFSHHGRFSMKQTKRKVLWQPRNRTS
jgi:hypothetical protein